MGKISIVFPVSYNDRGPHDKYVPMIEKIGSNIEKIYGIKKTKNCKYNFNNPKLVLTRISSFISWHMVDKMQKWFHYPQYFTYFANIVIFDIIMKRRVANDNSSLIFTTPLLKRTVKAAKKRGKIIVLEAGNSEPSREYERIDKEYDKYNITHRYIYGDVRYRNTCLESFKYADKIVTISQISRKTYVDAGYDPEKLHLVSMAGTDFKTQLETCYHDKHRAFISTAFHNFIKGTHRLLLAWKKAGIEDVPLIIVGNLCEDIQEFIVKNGPFNNVIFTGVKADLSEWYKQYDAVGVLLSLSEGAGRVTPEMMSFGFPMIVSLDAACDLIEDGYNGFVLDPYDEKSLIETLLYFALKWDRVHEMKNNVITSVTNRTMQDYSLELSGYLEKLL